MVCTAVVHVVDTVFAEHHLELFVFDADDVSFEEHCTRFIGVRGGRGLRQ